MNGPERVTSNFGGHDPFFHPLQLLEVNDFKVLKYFSSVKYVVQQISFAYNYMHPVGILVFVYFRHKALQNAESPERVFTKQSANERFVGVSKS